MRGNTRRIALSGLLTALMLVFGFIERLIPIAGAPPGVKLGLANSVLLYAVYMMGVKESFVLMLLKVLLTGFLFGNPQSMVYSFSGSLLSLCAMLLMHRVRGVSPVGVSVVGACFFNVGQVIAAAVMVHMPALLVSYLPILLISAVVTGVLTGLVAQRVIGALQKSGAIRNILAERGKPKKFAAETGK